MLKELEIFGGWAFNMLRRAQQKLTESKDKLIKHNDSDKEMERTEQNETTNRIYNFCRFVQHDVISFNIKYILWSNSENIFICNFVTDANTNSSLAQIHLFSTLSSIPWILHDLFKNISSIFKYKQNSKFRSWTAL